MITGNITRTSKPDEDTMRDGIICTQCGEPCNEVAVDMSYSDQFGIVEDWITASDCCECECVDEMHEDEPEVTK